MVAGGGASVVYADTISDLGFGKELANYGEYSGAPTLQETYDYARTIFSLMCRHKDPKGKILIIGGGIANFTDVAATFTGIQKAMKVGEGIINDFKTEGDFSILTPKGLRQAGSEMYEDTRALLGGRQKADEYGLVDVFDHMTHINLDRIGKGGVFKKTTSMSPTFDRMIPTFNRFL
jgi:ATP citrate (pro-S)-lyase